MEFRQHPQRPQHLCVAAEDLPNIHQIRKRLAHVSLKIASLQSIRLRPVALPVEHGGWGLLLEPVALGLLLAPSLAGLTIAIGAIAAFLTRHPFKLLMVNLLSKRASPRSQLAGLFAILYASITFVCFALAFIIAQPSSLLPLLLAVPLMIVQLIYDSRGKSRTLLAELAGAIAVGAVSSAIAISGNWPSAEAFSLWLILSARAAPSTLYVRARLNLLHQRPASPANVIVAHVIALLTVIALAWTQLAPWLTVFALAVLLLRALRGFSAARERMTAKKLGLREVVYGVVTVIAVWLGYTFNW